jgi:stage V sporulation protein S
MAKMKVSSGSKPNSVAGALVGILNDNPAETVEITAVGAGSVNQAIKAVAIARGFVAPTGFDITIQPTFSDVEIDGVEKTAINLVAKKIKI